MPPLYKVKLLKSFRSYDNSYPKDSYQYAWQDDTGFIYLRGQYTALEFHSSARAGVDFVWENNKDPRNIHERVKHWNTTLDNEERDLESQGIIQKFKDDFDNHVSISWFVKHLQKRLDLQRKYPWLAKL